MHEVRYNPRSYEWRDDPYPKYRELRDHAPVHYSPESDMWVVSRHADVQSVLTAPEQFGSKTQFRQRQKEMDELSTFQKLRSLISVIAELKILPTKLVKARMLIMEDGEEHSVMRKLVNKGFTPRRVHSWDERIAELVEGCLTKIRQRERFDLVQELAIPLPVTVIAEWLGVEPEKKATFKRWSDAIIQGSTGEAQMVSGPGSPTWTAMVGLRNYLRPIVKARRAAPQDDLISILVQDEAEARLSDFEIFFFVLLLLIAGNETTTNLLGNCVEALLANPDQLDLVVQDPSLIPGLVEETLRYDSPVQFITRFAREDVVIAGTTIPRDAIVAVLLGSANRDERFWDEPDRFDVRRKTSGHLAFGFGAHFCLGASLARLEAKAALEALVPELPGLVRATDSVEFLDSVLIRGRVRLELEPRARSAA